MTTRKTWTDKLHETKQAKVKRIETDFADIPAGSSMFIATPQIIDGYVKQLKKGAQVNIKTLRKDLALQHGADYTCPVTTGIFLRIVAEAAYENLQQGTPVSKLTPFWRVIEPDSPLAKKLSFGQDFLKKQIRAEAR
ncbi:MAG: hypothetical protein JNK18_16830 [Cyclobacteriaceae bacterium]|jgi:hypothetical protein|nr:hypothetical protein [Cyclobacteriaceae bacterium]